jgi:hypothetical protein
MNGWGSERQANRALFWAFRAGRVPPADHKNVSDRAWPLRQETIRITMNVHVLLESALTLTVRLDSAIESALERHCAERGMTKSAVVQESIAAYLWGGGAQSNPQVAPSS